MVGDVASLLTKLNVDEREIEREHPVPSGRIDIYLPRYRIVIETKAVGKAANPEAVPSGQAESPLQQLDRYLQAATEDQMRWLPFDDAATRSKPWRGIVTDGKHWHFYERDHEAEAVVVPGPPLELADADGLLERLGELLHDRPVGRMWIPAHPAELFRNQMETLYGLYKGLPEAVARETRTKQALWHNILRVSGLSSQGQADPDRLYVLHTLLIVIARLVTQSLTRVSGQDWDSPLREGFASWVLAWPQGRQWCEAMWNIVRRYDWRQRRGDVLRSLYESFIAPADRKVFGEFYTPDWLAGMLVEQILDEEWLDASIRAADNAIESRQPLKGIGVLDPSCGSGTFLYHAALRILDAPAMRPFSPGQQANITTLLVNGLDVHPVAVEIARANLLRALPAEPTSGLSALRIWLGDSLLARVDNLPLFDEEAMRLSTPLGRSIAIPQALVQRDDFADSMRRLVVAVLNEEPVPPAVEQRVPPAVRAALQDCRNELADVVAREGNSVWAWYATNVAAPHLLADRKVNRIVANPPWVKLANIQELERKRAMERLCEKLKLAAGGKQAPHLDIAACFVLQSRDLYLHDPKRDPAIWLVKKSALKAGHWSRFRELHSAREQEIDLEPLQPFGGGDAKRCCLLFEITGFRRKGQRTRESAQSEAPETKRLTARMATPRKPEPEDSWRVVQERIEFADAPNPLPQAASAYHSVWRQGATIVPHVLLLAEEEFVRGGFIDVRTRKSKHHPWSELDSQHVEVPRRWLSRLYSSTDMRPFVASVDGIRAIIPVDESGKVDLQTAPHEFGWAHLDETYRKHRGKGKHTPRTLTNRIDFNGELSAQPRVRQGGKRMVLYPASGDIMRAARTQPGRGFVDSTLYWFLASSADEAAYLTALLNATCLSRAFAETRTSGRDFHLHPFRKVPIQHYDPNNPLHVRLAGHCAEAEQEVEGICRNNPKPSAATVRKTMASSDVMGRINELAGRLLPDQVS